MGGGKKHIDRSDFLKGRLEGALSDEPMKMFSTWYQEASEKNCADPHAMVISTAFDNRPSSRIVYLRNLVEEGFVFYTNYESRKGTQISDNSNVSALFYWDCAERQVRVEGKVEKVDPQLSDDYFSGRPRISKIGAWASNQSRRIDSREELEARVKHFEEKFPNEVPRPPHWGGFILKPEYVEFWQGRLGRLHDRICFEKKSDNEWDIFRIAP